MNANPARVRRMCACGGALARQRNTLVISDHNGAFKPDVQPTVRYTQSHVALKADSITKWKRASHVRTASLAIPQKG